MRKLISITLCLLLVRTAVAVAVAATPATATAPDNVLRLQARGDVRAIEQVGDSLWVGTGGGLFIYDLLQDRLVAEIAAGQSLPSNSVRAMGARRGSVYVGTDGGLSIFAPEGVRVYTTRSRGGYDAIPFERIRSVDFGLDGTVYLGSYGLGLSVIRADTNFVITRRDSLLDNKVYRTVQEDDITFYFATSLGLCAWSDSVWVSYQAGAGLPRGEVKQMIPTPNGEYILLVGGRGVWRFNGIRARRISRSGVFPQDDIAAVCVAPDGVVWAAGRFGGIAAYQNGRWTRVGQDDPHVQSERWRCGHASPDGTVFFGSAGGLVVGIDDRGVRKIRLPQQLRYGSVRSIAVEPDGTVYLLDGAELLSFSAVSNTLVPVREVKGGASLAVSPAGELWVAGRWGLFRRQKDALFAEVVADVREREPSFTCVAFDSSGYLWTATHAGNVYRYDGTIWVLTASSDELFGRPATALVTDGSGTMWAVVPDAGLAAFSHFSWSKHSLDSVGGQPIRDVTADAYGNLAVLTGGGVWRRSSGRWRSVELDNRLLDYGLRQLAFDTGGRMYVGTAEGLALVTDEGTRWVGTTEGLGGAEIAIIYIDAGKDVWIGFRDDGVARIPVNSLW